MLVWVEVFRFRMSDVRVRVPCEGRVGRFRVSDSGFRVWG
jgi:hypothetical protein